MTEVPDTLAESLVGAAFAAYDAVPDYVLESARLHMLDGLGVGMLGARRGPLRGLADRLGGTDGGAFVLGSSSGWPPSMAALLNGAYVHSLEYDDTHVASVMHGSSTLLPAALAAAQQHGATAEELLRAYTVGWEVLIRFGLAAPGALQANGFQTTSAAGPFAAALVSCLLAGDRPSAVGALGVAGMQPGGTFAFLADGDTTKAVQPGWAAHAGLVAADLARAGVTGPRTVLDGPYGFFRLFANDDSAAERMAQLVAGIGIVWHLPEAAFKLLPCCHFIHPYVEAVRDLRDEGLDASGVRRIRCHVPPGAAPVIAEPWPAKLRPATPHDARWSLPYVLAAALVDGSVSIDLFEQPIGGERARVAELVDHVPWPDSGFPARFPARVEVDTHDGRTLVRAVDDVHGGPGRPCSDEDIVAKARENLRLAGLSERAVEGLVDGLVGDSQPNLDELLAHLRV